MSRLALIADTHDETAYIERAVELFAAEGCDALIHAGDINSPDSLRRFGPLVDRGVNCHWIFGEHDTDKEALKSASDEIGATCTTRELSIGGLKVAVVHNPYGGKGQTRPFLLEQLCGGAGEIDLVVYGHFHYFNIKYPSHKSRVSVVCPGACRKDIEPRTVAILDTVSRDLRVFALEGREEPATLAFSTGLVRDGQSQLVAGPGLTDHFRRGVNGSLQHKTRNFWRINDQWGPAWVCDWLDPKRVLALTEGAG